MGKSIVNQMVSYSPILPSITEAHANYATVTSDHAPILATIPCKKSETGFENIRILSWNVLENEKGCGFAKNYESSFGETSDQKTERHQRIADGIKQMASQHAPQFITLQKVIANQALLSSLYNKIHDQIGADYEVVEGDRGIVDINGCITFYRKTEFVPTHSSIVKTYGSYAGGNITKFKSLKAAEVFEVRLCNANHRFTELTAVHQEETIKTFLNGHDMIMPYATVKTPTLSIIVGDFNGTVASIEEQPLNLTTCVTASCSRSRKDTPDEVRNASLLGLEVQGAWSTSGCFYAKPSTDTANKHEQAFVEILNPTTGAVLSNDEKQPLLSTPGKAASLPELQVKEMRKQRMAICIDSLHTERKIPGISDATTATLDNEFQVRFGSKIYVRTTTNLENEKGIGIILTHELAYFLNCLQSDDFHLEVKRDEILDSQHVIAYADDFNSAQLIKKIRFAADNKDLMKLANSIGQLNKNNKIDDVTKNAFITLFKGLQNEIEKGENIKVNKVLVSETLEFAKRLNDPSADVNEVLNNFAANLDRRTVSKPPMSKAIKTLLCGLIGCVIGMVIGIAVGAAITCYTGGFGAIPGMLLGMTKGFTMGTALATGVGAAGLFTGSSLGLFSAARNHAEHQLTTAAIKTQPNMQAAQELIQVKSLETFRRR